MEATRCLDGWIHRPARCSQRIGVVGRSRVEPHLVRSMDVIDGHRYAWPSCWRSGNLCQSRPVDFCIALGCANPLCSHWSLVSITALVRSSDIGHVHDVVGDGVLTLRRGWRIIGFLNLILAWIVASVLIYQGMTSMAALVLLLATATLLAIITYLTQSRDELLASQ